MTLTDLASLGSFISALAVAGSLIYLGLQTHQAAKHTKALITQNRTTRGMDYFMKCGEIDFVTASIAANGATPTPELVKLRQFLAMQTAAFMSWDESFAQ